MMKTGCSHVNKYTLKKKSIGFVLLHHPSPTFDALLFCPLTPVDLRSHTAQVYVHAPPFTSCVTLDKLLNPFPIKWG